VRENNSFILRCASKTCKRFITESDDEYEVALVAFCEAVRAFDAGTGGFRGFAALVIRRRLMDYFDSQSRRSNEISAGSAMSWDEDASAGVVAEVQQKLAQGEGFAGQTIRDEIEALGDVLSDYGFSFFDIAEASPKAAKTKHCCARAVNWMLALAERILNMRKTRSLPVAAISKALEIARKIIERHRRYIIAATEILDGDYPHLAEYMDYIKKERSL
jgi:RNA polymerase sigma factor